MKLLAFSLILYNSIRTDNKAPGDDEPWITRKFENQGDNQDVLNIDCA